MGDDSIRKKIGQVFMISYEGVSIPESVRELITERSIGGVLLFANNCSDIRRTMESIEELKGYASDLPLCVGVDHEGGRVHRLPAPVTHFPAMRKLGELYEKMPSSRTAYDVGRAMGRELAAIGVHIGFSPVTDVNTNPINPVIGDRSFSFNAEVVSMVSAQFIEGLQEVGVAACAKHFPGHGDTNEDSHKVLPRLPHNMKRLESVELLPFESAIQQKVASIMTAHVVYEGIDREVPATFSVKILRDLLKTELGFQGLVISDSLAMGAVINGATLEEAAIKAFLAGCDFLILGKDPEEVPSVLDAFEEALREGRIPMERLEEAYAKVGFFKEKYCKQSGKLSPGLEILGCPEHRDLVKKIKALA